uniref:MICOS complex subunit n=1 Tax=Brugia malayi TaxID=6279 RepID=A0A0J9Y0W7_BRUMA|nr:BMA-MOMA-1, isoform b [Brugia malayi]
MQKIQRNYLLKCLPRRKPHPFTENFTTSLLITGISRDYTGQSFSGTNKMSETLENIKSSIIRWWTAVNADKQPKPNPARMVTVQELPIYSDEKPYYKEVEELPMSIQKEMALLRRAALRRFGDFGESYLNVEEKSKKVFNSAQEFQRFLQEDYGLLPKAAAITIGGLTGFFLGMKKSVFRRFLYSGMGLLTMTAFCYPYEAIAVTRTAFEHGKMAWENFARSPEPPEYSVRADAPSSNSEQ